MTPKEKAEKLFEKMYFVDDPMGSYPMCFETAKKCALITVDEIISIKLLWFQKDTKDLDYWQEVRQELLNMK